MSATPDTEAVLRLCAAPAQSLSLVLRQFPGHEEHVARLWFASRGADPAATPAAAAARDRCIGPYERLQTLGAGAQGDVHLARDVRTQRLVALKVLRSAPTAHAVERLRHEAQAIARLRDPGIGEVLDADFTGPTPFLVMRYVDGLTLRDAREASPVALFATPDEPLPAGALRWFEQLARSVHAAHQAGVIHADLHPGNLMVTAAGSPVVLDFGTAKVEGLASITHTGLALGSARFAAPEVLRGRRADRRSDVFSLAAVMVDCLSLAARGTEAQGAVDQVASPDVRTVLRKAVAPHPHDRFATAEEFAEELRRIRVGEPIRTGSPGAVGRLFRGIRRNPYPFAAGLALLAMLAILLVTWQRTLQAQRRQDQAADHGRSLMAELAAPWSEAPIEERMQVGATGGASAEANELQAGVELAVGRNLRHGSRMAAAGPHLAAAAQNAVTGPWARWEAGLLAFDRDDAIEPAEADRGAAIGEFLQGLRARQLGDAKALAGLAAALVRADWPDPALHDEALALAIWLAEDDGATAIRDGLLPALPGADAGVLGLLGELARNRAAVAIGDVEGALVGLRHVRARLASRLGEDHVWTMRTERAIAEALAEHGELVFAARVCHELRQRQLAVHGAQHPEVVQTLLLEWQAQARARRPDPLAEVTAALAAVERTPGNRRLLDAPRAVEAAVAIDRPSSPPPSRLEVLDAEWQKQRAISMAMDRRFDELVDPERRDFQSQTRLPHVHLVEFPAHAACDRARYGETSTRYLSLLVGEAESRMRDHLQPYGVQLARHAMSIVLAHPDEVEPFTRLQVRGMFCKATLEARRIAAAPGSVIEAEDVLRQLRDVANEMRGQIGEEDPRFLVMAKNVGDSLCNFGGPAEAAEAVPFYDLLRRRNPDQVGENFWVAGATLRAGDPEGAEPLLAKLRALLGERPAVTDWAWEEYDRLRQLQTELRAARASEQVGR